MTQMHLRRRVLPGVAAAVTVAPLLAAAPAGSDASDQGRWFYTKTGIAELHERATGAGIRVALVDGRVNPNIPDLAGTNLTVSEPAFCSETQGGAPATASADVPEAQHTTNMSSIILGTGAGVNGVEGVRGLAPDAALVTYASRLADRDCEPIGREYRDLARLNAFEAAVADGADIIFVPGGTKVGDDDLIAALRRGAIVLGSGGNLGFEVVDRPATMNGVVAIGALGPDGERDPDSARGPRMGVIAPGLQFRSIDSTFSQYVLTDGASNATAYTAGALALVWSAYPGATGNQILQAMVRTTGGKQHDPQRIDDDWGYGIVNPRAMMAVDPTSLPDVNPFLSDDPGLEPTMDQVLGTSPAAGTDASPSVAPSARPGNNEQTPSASAKGDSSGSGSTNPVAMASVAGAFGLITVATVAFIAVRRKRTLSATQKQREPGGHDGR